MRYKHREKRAVEILRVGEGSGVGFGLGWWENFKENSAHFSFLPRSLEHNKSVGYGVYIHIYIFYPLFVSFSSPTTLTLNPRPPCRDDSFLVQPPFILDHFLWAKTAYITSQLQTRFGQWIYLLVSRWRRAGDFRHLQEHVFSVL